MKFDAYQMVTDRIISLLDSGIIPWARPWSTVGDHAWSRSTGRPYSFLNQMLLADPDKQYSTLGDMLADVRGEWLTFKQCQEAGGHVRKGEKGRKVVFFKMLPKRSEDGSVLTDEDGEAVQKIPYLTSYTVFRVDQCEGIEQKHHTTEESFEFSDDVTAESVAADYLQRSGVTLNHVKGNRAYYSPVLDTVVLPLKEQFADSSEYYSTLFHELTHSTGHESRLNRLSKVAAFGNDVYSAEELCAEIGSASILATLGLETANSFRNSTAYVQNWLHALKNDKKMVVMASARAEKALALILGTEVIA